MSTSDINVARKGNVAKNSLSERWRILSAEQTKRLSLYKHKGTKTHLENFVLATVTPFTEMIYPDAFNANFVTLMGQIPQLLTLILALWRMGLDLRGDSSNNHDCTFFWCGLALYWFNQHDLMDGFRARRQKSGSPYGRLFDEANDMIQMTCYSVILAYLWRLDNCFLELTFTFINVIFFTMEMKYILCHELILNIAEVGSVEIENFIASLFLLAGIYGSSIYEMTLGETFGFLSMMPGSGVQWKYILAVGLMPL
jgi:phosphatidylglycerophosphate synthase